MSRDAPGIGEPLLTVRGGVLRALINEFSAACALREGWLREVKLLNSTLSEQNTLKEPFIKDAISRMNLPTGRASKISCHVRATRSRINQLFWFFELRAARTARSTSPRTVLRFIEVSVTLLTLT